MLVTRLDRFVESRRFKSERGIVLRPGTVLLIFLYFTPCLTFSLRLMVTHSFVSFVHLLYRLVTRYVPVSIVLVTLLFSFTISNLCLWPYSLRLDFLYHTVQNNRVFPIHPLSDPFKVFLSYLNYSRVTTSHQ